MNGHKLIISLAVNLNAVQPIQLDQYYTDFTPQRLALKVSKAAERAIRQRHPWVFDQAITKQSQEGRAGDLAIIYDRQKNKLMAVGLYDPHSPIRVKLLSFFEPARLDVAWFEQKIQAAFQRRAPLLATDTNSYRLIYGENDGLPGLVADVYAGVLVLKLYSLIWLPYLHLIYPLLLAVSDSKTLVLRLSRQLQKHSEAMRGLADGQILVGSLPEPEVRFREHGLWFEANVVHGHKTGYFLDHRHNRKRVGELARGKKVLDVFAYAGGFSVHALAGAAREVVSLDISAQALEMARRNAALNQASDRHRIRVGDAFAEMEQLQQSGERFDLIVVDPPSFAKRASERDKAMAQYARLVKAALALIGRGGILVMASCSSRVTTEEFFDLVEQSLRESGRRWRELERSTHDVDHPIGFPEGAYLKCGFFEIL